MARTLASLLIGIGLTVHMAVRPHGAEPDGLLSGYTLTSWATKDGLPGTVWAIAQTDDGYLWLGTANGLVRFDGVRFVPWALGPTPLPKAGIRALLLAHDGTLWAGFDNAAGVSRLRDGQAQAFTEADGIALGSVRALAQDRRHTIWAASTTGLFNFDGERWRKLGTRQGFAAEAALSLFVGEAGALFVGTTNGVFRLGEDTEQFDPVTTGTPDVLGLSEDRTGTIWTTDPVVGFAPLGEDMTTGRTRVPGRGSRVLHDERGNLWVGTLGQGLWRVKPEADAPIEQVSVVTGLPSNRVQALLEDREGSIWAGTFEGLSQLTPHRVTPVMTLGLITAVVSTPDGDVWVATTEELIGFSERNAAPERAGRRLPLPGVTALAADAEDGVWAATNDALFRVTDTRVARVPLPLGPPLNRIASLALDHGGGLWIFDSDHGLFRWRRGRLDPVDSGPNVGRAQVRFTGTDRYGRLWIGGAGSPFVVVVDHDTARSYGPEDGFRSGPYNAIYEDRAGTIWFGGDQGLTLLHKGRPVSITRANGLPSDIVLAIAEDQEHDVWLATGAGIVRIARHQMEMVAEDATHQIRHRLYDKSDGLAGLPIRSRNRGALRSGDGRLWFVTGRGLTIVDSRTLGEQPPADVRIEGAIADGSRMDPGEQTLPAGTTRLRIDYTESSLASLSKTRFRYRLEGFDTDWVQAGASRQALYMNLPPRTYRFQVVANNDAGTWHLPGATWDFSIRPVFYKSLWFLALCTVTFAGLLAGGWQLHLRHVRREFSLVLAERTRLSHELHDTLLQSLVGVALQFEVASKRFSSSPAEARAHMIRMRKQVEQYIREARQSIWNLRSPALQTSTLDQALRESGERTVAGQPVRFEFLTRGTPAGASAEVDHQLLRIGQQAIHNAARHAQASRIRTELRYDDNAVLLRVSDDGRGFDPGARSPSSTGHYGITTMQERAEEIGARFRLKSAAGAGTVVEVAVPPSALRY